MEESYAKLRGGAGKLSVSHDSVFPGEVPHTRPLSSLATLEVRAAAFSIYELASTQNAEIPPGTTVHHERSVEFFKARAFTPPRWNLVPASGLEFPSRSAGIIPSPESVRLRVTRNWSETGSHS